MMGEKEQLGFEEDEKRRREKKVETNHVVDALNPSHNNQ